MKHIMKRITGLVLALVMVVTSFGNYTPVTQAASSKSQARALEQTPGMTFSMKYSGKDGNSEGAGDIEIGDEDSEEDDENSDGLSGTNIIMLGRGIKNAVTIALQANLNAGQGHAEGMYFELNLPVFRIEDGELRQLTEAEVDKLSEKSEEELKKDTNLIRVMAKFVPDDAADWKGYTEGASYWGNKVTIQKVGFLNPGKQAAVDTKFYFDGPIPENASAIVRLGGGYSLYKDVNNNVLESFYQPSKNQGDEGAIYTLICSNLQWEPSIEGVEPKSVLWDKYNYVTYKVTIKNTSEDKESYFNSSMIQMVVPTSLGYNVDGQDYGMHPEEAGKFFYNNGNPILNEDVYDDATREQQMIGVPGKGGVMIYDVTALEETEAGQKVMSEWDLTSFSNIQDENGNKLEEVPYYFRSNGDIVFSKQGKVYNQEGCKNSDGTGYDHTTYYVSIPMRTDIPPKYKENLNIQVYNTIVFGSDYEWTKTTKNKNWGFVSPKWSFTGEKYVTETEEVDGKEVEVKKDEIQVAINGEGEYYLGGFKNNGNVPVYNAIATDTIESDFEMDRISVYFNTEDGENIPELTDWFISDEPLEFEFLTYNDASGTGEPKSEFVSLGKLVEDSTLSTNDKKVWSFEIGTKIEDYVKQVTQTGKKCVCNNRFRFKFKKQINANEEFDGKIGIHGVVGKGKKYTNNLDVSYEKWIWDPTISEDTEDGYIKTVANNETDSAVIQGVKANPKLDVTVIEKTESGYNHKDTMTIPVNVSGYGFFYQLANDSDSKIVPGEFSTGTVASVNATTNKVEGFLTEKIVISKRLIDEIATIGKITLHTSVATDSDIELKVSDFSKDADGNYYIEKNKWSSKGEILSVNVEVKKFAENIVLDNDNIDIYVALEGQANIYTPNPNTGSEKPENVKEYGIRPQGTFETKYSDADLNVYSKDKATMHVSNINPVIRGYSYGKKYLTDNSANLQSSVNKATGAATQSTVNSVETPNDSDDAGYKFFISNATLSPAGKAEIKIDLSSSIGNKTTTDENIRGYKTGKITISGFDKVADIKQIRLYNYDKTPGTDSASTTIDFDKLTVSNGSVTIDLSEYEDILYLNYIYIDIDDFKAGEKTNAPEMEIDLNGIADWYGNLDAKLTFTPENDNFKGTGNTTISGNTKGIVSLTDRIYVEKPYPTIHTDVHYYNLNGTTKSDSSSSDGNSKWLGLPYDRDFTYTIDVNNTYKAKLDEFDLVIDLPINNKSQGTEANTGFHTTGIRLSKELIEQYEILETITLYDVDSSKGIKFKIDYANKTLISEDGKITIPNGAVDSNGDIYIEEKYIYTDKDEDDVQYMNIKNLKKIVITGKKFDAAPGVAEKTTQRVTIYGFSDSNPVNTENKISVTASNYLCGFRNAKSEYILTRTDNAKAFISKMYFDTTIVAGYKDNTGGTSRFDQVSTSYEHVRPEHTHYYGWTDIYNDDVELDIGYKAIGSYMIDFRQYLNAGSNKPSDANHHQLNDMSVDDYHDTCTAYDYYYTQSMNTAADVEMTVNLPSDSFDAYYMKVHPWAYPYMKSVKIHRKGDDNNTWTTVDNWKESVEKVTGTSDSYYRVDLRKLGDEYGIYESPLADYKTDKPVDKIIITLNINREASTVSGANEIAKNADYGTWYNFSNESTKYMFEVTGRFYKMGAADATASTKMDIGQLSEERPYAKAKKRSQTGVSNGTNNIYNSTIRSSWSWQDYWRNTCCGSWHAYSSYKAAHMFSTAKVYVQAEGNTVKKGVHQTINTKSDTYAKFSLYNEYSVSFSQAQLGSVNDCSSNHGTGVAHAESGGYTTNNDVNNWANKHSFTDKVVLTDTLPYVRPDDDTEYYGFLTKKIFISQDIKQYIDKIVIYKKKSVSNGDGTYTDTAISDTVEISPDDLVKESMTNQESQVQGSDQHIVHSTSTRTFYEIPVIYSEKSSSEDNSEEETTTENGQYEGESQLSTQSEDENTEENIEDIKGAIVLGEDEYVVKYEIHMKNLPGDGDYAAELQGKTGLLDSYNHGSDTTPDVYVGGGIYRVTQDSIINSGDKNDYNTIVSNSYMQGSNSAYHSTNDKALITSYRIPFQGGFTVTRGNNSNTIYDYEKDNLTPTVAKFDVRIWNRKDVNQEESRSAELDTATATNSMDGDFRLKHIYIPTEFIEGSWFNVEYLKLGNDEIKLEDLKKSKYFKKDNDDATRYIFDVNAYIRDGIKNKSATYSTVTPNNTKKNSSTYYKEYISTFVIKFKGVGKNILDGGWFLNSKCGNENLDDGTTTVSNATPTYSYDGIYVDRNEEDIIVDRWTYDSMPTIVNSANNYTYSSANYNSLNVAFTTTESDYSWRYGQNTSEGTGNNASGTQKSDYYYLNNRVGTMYVNMSRTSQMDEDNTSVNTFAYDIDGNTQVAVDSNHLLPDDIVEYQITVGAKDNTLLPIYHPDVRFKAPTGQRIVGWYVLNNDSKIPVEDITAKAVSGNNSTTDIVKGLNYYKLSDDIDTNYKQLDISCGNTTKSDDTTGDDRTKYDTYNQLNAGESIKIVVVTQLTHEMDPFEGKIVNDDLSARIYVSAHPKHTFSQYSIVHENGNSNTSASSDYYTDSNEGATYNRTRGTGFYGSTYNNENTYYTSIRSKIQFFSSALSITTKYVDDYNTTNDTNPHIDERPMIVQVRGKNNGDVTNDTLHTLSSATYTVSFISENGSYDRWFKGFDLLQKPTFSYPSEMDESGTKNAKVEYCFYKDKTTGEVIHTSTTAYNSETGEYDEVTGIYDETKYDVVWLSEDKVLEGDKLTESQAENGYQLVRDAVKIRWTYEDIPAKAVLFATKESPFEFHGIGRYRDIRKDSEKQNKVQSDDFTIGVSVAAELVHSHDENVSNTDENAETKDNTYKADSVVHEKASTTNTITRERPIVTVHTQIFDTEENAGKAYTENAAQVKGYRPGDSVWYKDTVINNKAANNKAQGALLEPVIFDKIPEYITTSLSKGDIIVKWYDADNNLKDESEVPDFEITASKFEDVADYGGDFVTTKNDNDGNSLSSGHAFADLTFGEGGNTTSTEIDYNVYKIQFEKGSRLEIGERLEIYYKVTIRTEDLPLSYTKRIISSSSTKIFVDYYPKMGEYNQWKYGWYSSYSYDWSSHSYPYTDKIESLSTQFANSNDMMDMNYLIHDVGVSGQKNKNIDRYEFLKDSIVYMPGSGTDGNNYSRTDIYGSNGYLKDEDVRTKNNQQKTYYVPTVTADKYDKLPVSETYRNNSITGTARDWYNLLMKYRVRSTNWQQEHLETVIWSESRLHLQTGWLAASSEMIGDTSSYLKSHEYMSTNFKSGKLDDHYISSKVWSGCNTEQVYTTNINDDVIETLEYDQYFTSRIGAYNYGDWDITGGIEFTYIMPQGIEPKLDKDGNPDFTNLKAEILSSGTSSNPGYTTIDSKDVEVEVLQKPGDKNPEYKTPNIMRDPVLSSSAMNKSGDSYANKEAYYETDEQTSWVLKITVKKSLGKWFNRGANCGYAMYVNIPSHVYATPQNEYWYDEVMVKPVDTDENLYYQVYDTTSLWGNTDVLNRSLKIGNQKGGMDYLYNPCFLDFHKSTYWGADYHVNTNTFFWNGSPNMPYINGMNISNNEVSKQGIISDSVEDDRSAFSKGKRDTYASTGTRAHMRKPLVRTWTTVGENNINGSDTSAYYINVQGDTSTLNIHVENKYWLNTLAPVYLSNDYQDKYETYKYKHTYATDGGSMGTLYHPVITQILPYGIVPKDTNGELFTTDNDLNSKKTLDWTLRGANYSSDGKTLGTLTTYDDEKELYEAVVEYIQLEVENGEKEGRYQITFKQKETPDIRNEKKAKINSESARVFSFKFFNADMPDNVKKDGTIDERLDEQYQSTHTFVSSELKNFKFIIDSEVTNAKIENPYYVGNSVVDSYVHTYKNYNNTSNNNYYNWLGTISDERRDKAVSNKTSADMLIKTAGILPKVTTPSNLGSTSAINATDVEGNKRYIISNGQINIDGIQLNMEDYPTLRYNSYISSKDCDMDNGNTTTATGVHTSARIRVKFPYLENKSFVSTTMAEDINSLGGRSSQWQKNQFEYYPSSSQPVEYMDKLYYNVKITNGADNVGSTNYYYHGDLAHGKIKVTMVLPSIVKSVPLSGDNLSGGRAYILYQKAGEKKATKIGIDEAKSLGWEIEVIKNEVDDNNQQTIVFEICTAGDFTDGTLPTYQDYVDGKKVPGYFGYKDTIVVGVKTEVRNNTENTTEINYTNTEWSQNSVWDKEYKADTYVTVDDSNGYYLKEMNEDGNFDLLTDLKGAGINYARATTDDKESAIDWDKDEDYTDEYAKDVSAIVTLLKPHSTVRIDTSVQREIIENPDLGISGEDVIIDPTVKSSVFLSMYMDQAVNEGGAVREFIVDWRIPFRSTSSRTNEEAPVTGAQIDKDIYAIGTGVWEIPSTAGKEEYREQLYKKLKVQVLALCSDDATNQAEGASYENIDNVWNGKWINLTELYNKNYSSNNDKGVSIDKNTVINLKELSAKIYNGQKDLLSKTIYQIRYVISSEDEQYVVPSGFRLDIDADSETDGKQEMNEIDPKHDNVEELPNNVVSKHDKDGIYTEDENIGNAAFVMMRQSHLEKTKQHVNHFVTGWTKYDDTQYCVDSERSRAGYYIAVELPVMEIDLTNQYFKNARVDDDIIFKWSDDIVINDTSNMLKYTVELRNLSNEKIEEAEIEREEDMATNPQIVVELPIIHSIDNSIETEEPLVYKNYKEAEYGEELWKQTLAPDCTMSVPFEDGDAVWSWHVEDEEGNVVDALKHRISSIDFIMYDKVTGVQYTKQRRLMRWTSNGQLAPGQKIVIDFMVPVSTGDSMTVSADLLNCKAYGFKTGAFIPHVLPSEKTINYAYISDTRDVNDNGASNNESAITVSLSNIAFSGTVSFNRRKQSFSDYGTGLNAQGNDNNRPSLVPEGTTYSFISSIYNPLTTTSTAKGYKQPVIYDVLPYVGDTQLVPYSTDSVDERGSDWRGWLNLDSLEVVSQAPSAETTLTDGKDVNIWIGPFNYSGSDIVKIDVTKLPTVIQTSSVDFYTSIRGEGSKAVAEKKKYFVRLKDLLKLKISNPTKYEELEKHAQAIYVEPTESYVLGASTKLALSYSLRSPLNIPLSKKYIPEESENILQEAKDVDGWNSFSAQSEKDKPSESPYAGVYLAAPYDRGYIGHYVWLDESYNAQFTDEGEYIRQNSDGTGRWLLDKATKDLDYDGDIDDPGINGVKVELLTEKGYPVNRLGEAVVEKDGRYFKIDEETGKILKDEHGTDVYTAYGPMSYTTEKDVYGNDGYFIISNIKPGKYNLRYTFPEDSKYNKYALTTKTLGISETGLKVYRPGEDTLPDLGNTGKGDEPSDAAEVKSLTIQTTEPIQIDAIGKDETTYVDYDEKMTSYDLGVAPSFAYGGYSWMDITYDKDGKTVSSSINGKMEDGEKRLKNVGVFIYEVQEDGTYATAYDSDGNKISYTDEKGNEVTNLYTDSNGYFKTTLYPYRSYIIITDTKKIDDILKPTPYTMSTRPLQYEPKDDNDLLFNEQLKKNTTNVFVIKPQPTDYTMGKCVEGQYGTYNRLGLGFVPAGIGAIGKYVFNDENYDGIRNEYKDSEGYLVTEPGIDNVKLILEKYCYKNNKWELVSDNYEEVTSIGSSYTFIVDSSEKDADTQERYLCGYRVKVDMNTVPKDYVPTKFYMNDGVSDSDLPITGERYRYLTGDSATDLVIIADEKDEFTELDYTITADGKEYDIADAQIITKYDAGFALVEYSQIDGIVWNDKNYDGKQGTYINDKDVVVNEPGIANIELQLVPYVYNNNEWQLLEKDDLKDTAKYNNYVITTKTDANGKYSFKHVESVATLADGTKCITGYKIKINTDIEKLENYKYGITKYKNGTSDLDSDLWKTSDGTLILNSNDEFIITAKKIKESDAETDYGKSELGNQDEYLIKNKLGYFDINKVANYEGNDAGLVEFRSDSVSGKVWIDDNYNGIMDSSEQGMVNQKVTIKRYYLESVADGKYNWIEDLAYTNPVSVTDANGDFIFKNLVSYVYKDGKYYLAGYKVFMKEHPDVSIYGITLYGKYDKATERGSDLKIRGSEITKDDDYLVVAKSFANVTDEENSNKSCAAYKSEELAHVAEYKGKYYDLVTARSYENNDAGYIAYPTAYITGNAFEDFNYDGLINVADDGNNDSFTNKLKTAMKNGKLIVKATAYYYDGGQWKKYVNDKGIAYTYTDTIDATSTDGSFTIGVPTKVTVNGKNYLAGYKLDVNDVPTGYHITRHKADGKVKDSNALIKQGAGQYNITKTLPDRGYAGTIKEEMDGYIIPANPSTEASSSNVIGDYDIAVGRYVKEYNLGFVAHEEGSIDGVAFEDKNDNGKCDKSDKLLSGVKVGVKRYAYDPINNKWTKAPDSNNKNAEYYATTTTDSDGYYLFDNLPTHEDTSGDATIYGYTVWLIEMPKNDEGFEYAAAYYQSNSDKDDSALIAETMQVFKADNNPNIHADELRDGNTVLVNQTKADAQRSDITLGYDCTAAEQRTGYNLGFVDYAKGSIEGCVFDDKNIDGIIDSEDGKLENIELGLKRYLYENGQWKEAQNDSEYYRTVRTDANGNYKFDDLETFTTKSGNKYLYGYEVWVINSPSDYGITRYQMNNGSKDSAVLLSNQIKKKDGTLNEVYKDKLVVARKATTENKDGLDNIYVVEGYDVVRETNLSEYNAGYTVLKKGVITGTVFDDADYDGLIDNDESLLEGVKIGLKRYVYQDGMWILAQDGDYFETTTTDVSGQYEFANLKTHINMDGKNYLYGYEVWIVDGPDGYAVTRYGKDSFLKVDGHVVKADTSLSEIYNGKTVVAHKITDEDNLDGIDNTYIVDGYNVILASLSDNNNAGYIKEQKGSISGTVFDDVNYDGTIYKDDKFIEGTVVGIKQFVYDEGKWTQTHKGDYLDTMTTDENGNYKFDNLETHKKTDDGNKLYGYEVWIIEGPDGYAVTRYGKDSYLKVSGQVIKSDTSLSEKFNGKTVIAHKVTEQDDMEGIDDIYVVEGYNIVLANDSKKHNAGYVKEQKGSISGTVFEDINYDGILNDNKFMGDIKVGLKQFVYEDGEWKQTHEDDFIITTKTDNDGNYKFSDLDTYKKTKEGNKLYGYEVWIIYTPKGYAVTRYGKDSYLKVNSRIVKEDETLSEIYKGKTVVAHKITSQENLDGIDDIYFVEGYNIVLAQDSKNNNAGYIKEQKGSIKGTVFDDIDYDGRISEEDIVMEGFMVGLKQFVYENGQWEAVSEDGEFLSVTTTDANGNYEFNNLEIHKKTDDGNKLYGYEVWIIKDPDGYAVTRYGEDSYLLVSGQVIKDDKNLSEMFNEKTVVAYKITDDDYIDDIDDIYLVEGYNVVLAQDSERHNAGYYKIKKGSITGTVFDDVDYDGLIDEDDYLLENIEIGLKRYIYIDGEWVEALKQTADEEIIPDDTLGNNSDSIDNDKEDGTITDNNLSDNESSDTENESEFFATTLTDKDGNYSFENLDVYMSEDKINYMYGYEVYVINHENRHTTKYWMNNGEDDSSLRSNNYQILKTDDGREELFNGCIVLAKKAVDEENPNTPYIVEGYDVVNGVTRKENNAGFVAKQNNTISGLVWIDADNNGILEESETPAKDVNVILEKLYLKDGQWMTMESDKFVETVTGEDGTYKFENLELYGYVDEKMVVYGYKVKIPTLPTNYGVTVFHAQADGTKNDLNEKTGYLEDEQALIVLADKADENTPEEYNVDEYNISHGSSLEGRDAGIVPYGVGSIEGCVFEDADKDGKLDEDEEIFEGEKVYLEYKNSSEDAEFVRYTGGKAVTDKEGKFKFENLPVLDENNMPYEYRLTMKKPEERSFTKVFAFEIQGSRKVNILYSDTNKDEKEESATGITQTITLAVPRSDSENYYNLKYEFNGYEHTNAYLGFTAIENAEIVQTGMDMRLWLALIPILLAMFAMAEIVVQDKRKKKYGK